MTEEKKPTKLPSRRELIKSLAGGVAAGTALTAASYGYASLIDYFLGAKNVAQQELIDQRAKLGTSTPPSESDLKTIIEAYHEAYKTAEKKLSDSDRHELAATSVINALKQRTLQLENQTSEDDLSIILSKYGDVLSYHLQRQREAFRRMPPTGL